MANCGFYLAQGLSNSGHQVRVILDEKHKTPRSRFSNMSLPNVNVKWVKPKYIRKPRFFGLFFLICNEIRKNKPDIIHVNYLWSTMFIAQIAAFLFRIPIVAEGHGWDVLIVPHSNLRGAIQKFFLNWVSLDKIILTADYYVEKLDTVPDDKKIFIDRAIDTDFFTPITDDLDIRIKYGVNLITFITRINKQKSPYTVLTAFKKVVEEFPDAKLLVIGEGSEKTNMQSFAWSLLSDENVIFLGEIPNTELPKYRTASKAEVHGFQQGVPEIGISHLESLSCGTPIITSAPKKDIQGLIQAFTPNQIAKSIIKIFKDEDYRTKLGNDARDYMIKNRSIKIRTTRILQVYQDVMEQNQSSKIQED